MESKNVSAWKVSNLHEKQSNLQFMSAIITHHCRWLLTWFKFRNDATEDRSFRYYPLIAHSDHRGAHDPVDFTVASWIMPDLSSALIRLGGRLMELQGISSSRPGRRGDGNSE